MHEAPEAKTNSESDASSKIRSRLEGLSTRFDGFEDELSLSRHRRKKEEDERLAALQLQLNNLQASLALESKNRAMSVKALQNVSKTEEKRRRGGVRLLQRQLTFFFVFSLVSSG